MSDAMVVCPHCGTENPEGVKFCHECGHALVRPPEPRQIRKTVTILFSDVTGSTGLGERLDPESLRRVMSRYFGTMRKILEQHGGTVEKFIGDAIMAVFGIPQVHEDDALRAVRAAAEMGSALEELNDRLESEWGVTITVRTGINTGEVVAGDPESGGTLVVGDPVNVAARLEQVAPPGDVLIGDATLQLVRDAVTVEDLGPLDLKGKGQSVAAFRLVDVDFGAPGRARQLSSPMVGRGREFGLLLQAFDRLVEDRSSHLFTVLGVAGVGKTRLVAEFAEASHDRAAVLQGRCLSYGKGVTFLPVADIVRAAAGVSEVDSAETAMAKIEALAGGSETGLVAHRVAELIGLTETISSLEECFWAVRKLFEAMATRRPLVLIFDDAHWAEPSLLDLIEHISDWSRDAPILLLCVARPELLDNRPNWGGGKLNATTIALEPLTEGESSQLIENFLGDDGVTARVTDRIKGAAGGNPLFVEETLNMLVDDGYLRQEAGRWVAARELEDVSVPPTIHALLAARLDRLQDEERNVIERASVAGKEFYRGAVVALTPDPERPRVDSNLMMLVRKELIRPDRSTLVGDEAFRFLHVLLRDTSYESMPKETRAELHERFADWLGSAAGERIREYEEVIGYHLEQAFTLRSALGPIGDHARALATRAAETLAHAGRRAFARGDMPAAVNLLTRATRLLAKEDELRLELLPVLGAALVEAGELGRAEAVLSESVDIAIARDDKRLEAHATVERLNLKLYTVENLDLEVLREETARLIPVFERLEDEAGMAKGWGLVADIHWTLTEYGAAEKAIQQVIEHARRAGDKGEEARTVGWFAAIGVWGPTPVPEAIRRCQDILERFPGYRVVEVRALSALATLRAMEGEFEESRSLFERARGIGDELGQLRQAALSDMAGVAAMLEGDPVGAERELVRGFKVLEAMGEKGYLSTSSGLIAQALYEQDRLDEAEEFAAIGKDAAADDDIMSQVLWRAALAKVLARRDRGPDAEKLAREAVDIVSRTEDLNLHGLTLLDLATVLELLGRTAEARTHVEEAVTLFERKGNVAALRRAEARLARR